VVKLHPRTEAKRSDSLTVNPLFARRAEDLSVPRFALPQTGMLPETAYQLVHDEAMLDGNARLNLATFVTTWMEPLAAQLYRDTFDKNMIDKDEYPLTAAIEERCWRMLADLWHAPQPKTTIGTSTVGSSEACMLAGLALKRRWQNARRAAGKSANQPNLVMSSAVQVVWEKFDGASGAFVAPFLRPDLVWDFQLPRVYSISTSGHKYGLVYPGIGWVIWRTPDLLPDDLIFRVAYLGGEMPTLALNFSRPGAQVLLQYYNFLRLGFEGYRQVQQASQDVARSLSSAIAEMGPFELLSDGTDLPVFAWRLGPNCSGLWDLHDLSNALREQGWQVPAYPLPDNMSSTTVQRIVVRNGVSMDLADYLIAGIRTAVRHLENLSSPMPRETRTDSAYHH
jgi:glutamate/tyrosine decarboxylase-like PLP-dependent enzyme